MTKDDTQHMRYFERLPRKVPPGRIVAHNHVRHTPRTPIGLNGFRAWTDLPSPDHYVKCDCGWAAHLPKHYRVKRS